MPAVGFKTFVPKQCTTVFRVINIAPNSKRIRVFNSPIKNGHIRDLMDIPEVSEADIRHSLLKGELNTKIRCDEIRIVESSIDLLQFDECQKAFLEGAGITNGLEVDGYNSGIPFLFKQGQFLIGIKNNVNRTFTVPSPDEFIQGTLANNEFRILIRHNGRVLAEDIDYSVSESGGAGTGYDTVNLTFSPKPRSVLIADYVIAS